MTNTADPAKPGAPTAPADQGEPTSLDYADGQMHPPIRRTLLGRAAREAGASIEMVLAEAAKYSSLELVVLRANRRPITIRVRRGEAAALRRALDKFEDHFLSSLVAQEKRNPHFRPRPAVHGVPRGRTTP